MSFATGAVGDNAGDIDRFIKHLVADEQGRDAAHGAARINHHDHRAAERFRQRGIAVTTVEIEAIVQSFVALDQANIGPLPAMTIIIDGLLAAGNVEVETDAAGNQKPSKGSSQERIDGMVALTMSEARWMAHIDDGIPMVAIQ